MVPVGSMITPLLGLVVACGTQDHWMRHKHAGNPSSGWTHLRYLWRTQKSVGTSAPESAQWVPTSREGGSPLTPFAGHSADSAFFRAVLRRCQARQLSQMSRCRGMACPWSCLWCSSCCCPSRLTREVEGWRRLSPLYAGSCSFPEPLSPSTLGF